MEIKELLAKLNVPEMEITIDLGDDLVYSIKKAQYGIIRGDVEDGRVTLMLKPDRSKPLKVIPHHLIRRVLSED